MRNNAIFAFIVSFLIASFLPVGPTFARYNRSSARMIDPIVSTDWLADNMDLEGLVILDVRLASDYAAGHIPNSINEPFVVPFSAWITMSDDGLLLELPDRADLFDTIGSLGITGDSLVVIVTAPNPGEPPFYGLSSATRVALTLIYAGVKNVSVLDGGFPKWVVDGYGTINGPSMPTPVSYEGETNEDMFVSIDYVRKHLHSDDIIDARDADVYFGITIEPFADKAGHIPNAASLPGPWIWNLNGVEPDTFYTYKDPETLGAMASGVLREPYGPKGHWGQKIIVYCGVGGYASAWWYVLTQVLEYKNVKFYDGAAQEWASEEEMVPFQWD